MQKHHRLVATRPEFMRRMKDMASMQGGMGAFYASMPDEVTLTVNGNHPSIEIYWQNLKRKSRKMKFTILLILPCFLKELLKGNTLTNFINRSVELMR